MDLSKKQRGAFNEARAVAWMIGHGFEVFIQFGEGVIDLVGYKPSEGHVVRCEVKTAQPHTTKAGDLRWYWRTRRDQMLHVDMLICVTADGRVFNATATESPVRDVEVEMWDGGITEGERMPVKAKPMTKHAEAKIRSKRPIMDDDGHKIIYDD